MSKIIDNLKKLNLFSFGKKSNGTGSYYDRFFESSNNYTHTSTLNNSTQYLNAIETVTYVGRCVSTIAGDVAALKCEVVNKSSGKVVENSKLKEVLDNPYPGISYAQFLFMITSHMLLDGNAFLIPNLLENFFDGRLDTLYPVIPSDVDIISTSGQTVEAGDTDSYTGISHYRCTVDRMPRDLSEENVFHLKTNCVKNIIRGMGEVQKNALTMEQDQVATTLSKQFFQKGVFSNILITPPSDMAPEQFDLWQKLMNAKITGNKNWFDPLYTLPGGDVNTLSMSMKDMEMIEKQKFTKQTIASAFYLPDLIAGLDGSGKYDTAPEQIKIYYENTLPRFTRPLERFLNELFAIYEPENEFRFVGVKYVDPTKLAPVINSSFDRGIISRNDGRELLGLDRIDSPEMDEFYMLLNYVPASSINEIPEDTSKDQEETKAISCGCGHDHDIKATDSQMQFHRASKKTKQRIEKKMIGFVNDYAKGLEKRAIKGLEKDFTSFQSKGMDIDDVFDRNVEEEEMMKSARKMFTSGVSISITTLNDLTGANYDASTRNYKIPLVVEKLAKNYVDLTIDTRRDELRKIISDSLQEGLGVTGIKERIQDEMKALTGRDGWKAIRIARTESSNAYHYASKDVFEELGVKKIDIVGCLEGVKPGFDCLKTDIPIGRMTSLRFPPNHTGTAVPAD